SNLYALRLGDGALLRVTRVLGGAFDPEPSPDGRQLLFADYSGRGYDLRAMDIDLGTLQPAAAAEVTYPSAREAPPPAVAGDRAYRPGSSLWPRFWMPFGESVADELRLGAFTAGAD